MDGLEVTLSKLGNDKVAINFSKGQRVTTAIAIIPDLIRNTGFDAWQDSYTGAFHPAIDEFIQNVNRILVAIDAPDNRTQEQIEQGRGKGRQQGQGRGQQQQQQQQSRLMEEAPDQGLSNESHLSRDTSLVMPTSQPHHTPFPTTSSIHPSYGPPGFEDDYEMGGGLRAGDGHGGGHVLGGYGQSDLNPPGLSSDPSMRPSLGLPQGMSGGMFPSAADFGFGEEGQHGPDDLTRPPGSRYDAPGPGQFGSGGGGFGGGFNGGFGGSGGSGSGGFGGFM